MKWITSKLKVKAAGFPGSQMDLPMGTPSMGPVTNHINNPKINPFHDIEGPETHGFSVTEPVQTRGTGSGIRGSRFHLDQDGTRLGVAKNDANSHLKEPLVYQISKHIAPGIVPPTVARDHEWKTPKTTGARYGHSIQQAVPGQMLAYADKDGITAKHPDYAKTTVFDWLVGNHDRHANNVIYDKDTNRVHAIDNGGAFSYEKDHPIYDDFRNPEESKNHGQHIYATERISSNMNRAKGVIPPDLRENILKADPAKLKELFDRVDAHPRAKASGRWRDTENGFLQGNFTEGSPKIAWGNFNDRLGTLKDHMSDDSVKTMPDLYERLYPGDFVARHQNSKLDPEGTSAYLPGKYAPEPQIAPQSNGPAKSLGVL